jgi:hypothetical protein
MNKPDLIGVYHQQDICMNACISNVLHEFCPEIFVVYVESSGKVKLDDLQLNHCDKSCCNMLFRETRIIHCVIKKLRAVCCLTALSVATII